MREFLDENSLANTLSMLSAEIEARILVVEGDDDMLVLRPHIAEELQLVAGVGGRGHVLATAALTLARGIHTVRFLIDRDLDAFAINEVTYPENVFVSENHDLFMDLVFADIYSLDRVVEVLTATARRRPDRPVLPDPAEFRASAVELATALCAVRVVSLRREMCLDFKRFSFSALPRGDCGLAAIARSVLERNGLRPEDEPEFLDDLADVHPQLAGAELACIGDHDLFAAVGARLAEHSIHVGALGVQRGFILSVSCAAILATGWAKELSEWSAGRATKAFNCDSLSSVTS